MSIQQLPRALTLIQRGVPVGEVAREMGISRSALYRGLAEAKIERPRRLSPAEHVQLQRDSSTPPEVYAARAGLSLATLRRYAWQLGQPLALTRPQHKRLWWEAMLETYRHRNAQAFATINNLPMPLIAHWYHKLNPTQNTLLWGFTQTRLVESGRYPDLAAMRYAKGSFALGRGRFAVPVDIRTANTAFDRSLTM